MRLAAEAAILGLALAAVPASAATVQASSTAPPDEGVRFDAELAYDGLLATSWAEGEMGDGAGSTLTLRFDRAIDVESVTIWPGLLSEGQRSAREQARPHTVTLTLTLGDKSKVTQEVRLPDPGEIGPLRQDVAVAAKGAVSLEVRIDQAYRGAIRSDCAIAEVAINHAGGATPAVLDRLAAWQQSDAGKKADEKDVADVAALVALIQAAQFGDRDSLRALMDRAGDGAPYLRSQVRSLVPAGFRLAALPPDPHAIQALLGLADSNAIPAIERAALRVRGREQARLEDVVERFEAYQELIGGRNRNMPAFGASGISPGGLRGLGEPLGLAIDPFGSLWVADTGNHRVQRFGDDGALEKAWGSAEADITNVWFPKTRNWYAAGAKPGTDKGQFTAPVAVRVLPSKTGATAVVLDAAGRVTVIGEDDVVRAVWDIEETAPISAGVGGEGHLVLMGKRIVVIWGNEGYLFSMDGEAMGQFAIEDGSPVGAVALPGGKLGLMFDKQLVQYSLDGFRHGELLGDSMGRGFESWDLTYDEKGKLWAVTDQGVVVKFKKLGVPEFRVQVSETSFEVPRVAVWDGHVFVTSRDKILHFDALEARRLAELADEEAKTDDSE